MRHSQAKDGDRIKKLNFKLDALLAITQAINSNTTVTELLKEYTKILKDELNIGKLYIFSCDNKNDTCLLNEGFAPTFLNQPGIFEHLLTYTEITHVTTVNDCELFPADVILPVFHNSKPLAYVLIGDIDEDSTGISPVIKHLNFIQTISSIILVAIENRKMLKEIIRQESVRREIELAAQMQSLLVPAENTLPRNEKIYFSSLYLPHLEVGGDYFDVFPINGNEIGFCIADVSGKGITAAMLMSNFQASVRAFMTAKTELPDLLRRLNQVVLINSNGEKFVTFFIAIYNYATRQLRYVNAAQNAPLLYDFETKELIQLNSNCPGIGMLDEMPPFSVQNLDCSHHLKLICFTDGLAECKLDNQIASCMPQIEKLMRSDENLKTTIEQILDYRLNIIGKEASFDDLTLLGVEIF